MLNADAFLYKQNMTIAYAKPAPRPVPALIGRQGIKIHSYTSDKWWLE